MILYFNQKQDLQGPQHFNIYSVLKVVLFSYKKYLPACFPIKNVLTKKKERNKEVT